MKFEVTAPTMRAAEIRAHEMKRALGPSRPWARALDALRVRQDLLLVGGLTIVAAILRLYGMTDKSIWNDEAVVIQVARLPIPDLLASLIEFDPHPPLYYLFMHFWLGVGSDPFLARLPSALLSTASIPLLFLVGVRLFDRKVALGAAALLTVSALHIAWAQEARMYALLGLLCLASTYFLVRALQEGERASWVLHAVATAAALYTQFAAVFYVVAQGIAVAIWLIRQRPGRPVVLSWIASQVGAILLFSPWLPAMVEQNSQHGGVLYTYTSVAGIEQVLLQLSYGAFPYWRAPFGFEIVARDGVLLVLLGLAAFGAVSHRGRIAATLLPWLFFGSIALLALTGLWRAIIVPKAALPAAFAYYLLVSAGLAAWRRGAIFAVGIVLIGLFNIVGIVRYHQLMLPAAGGFREDWREVVADLRDHYRPGDVVLVDTSAGLTTLNYHLEQEHMQIEAYGIPFEPWAVQPPRLDDDDFARVDQLVDGRPTIWLVFYRNRMPDGVGQLLPYLQARYALEGSLSVSQIKLYQFVTAPRAAPAT